MAARGADAFLVRGDHFFKVRFLDGGVTGGELIDGALIDIDADDVEAATGNGGGHARAKFAESDDGKFHGELRG